MVRSISSNSQAKLDQNLGTEPALIIEIQWVDGGSIYTYSDKDLSGTEGRILQVSGLDNTVVVQGVQSGTSSDSQQISVTLDDTDGSIKDILDSHDVHKEPAWVYQWFQGLDTSDKFLIFKGQISSPIQWNEGDRTVSFDIITRIEDAEVGFSMEEGNFDYVPEDLVGKPWPLVFGTVVNCEALRTRTPRKGILQTGFGIRDYMLAPKKEQVALVCCPWRFVGFRSYYESGVNGRFTTLKIQPVFEKDVNCECKKKAIGCEMDLNIAQQASFEYGSINIVDGDKFPQGVFLQLDIGGARVSGYFNGSAASPSTTFIVQNRIHPKALAGDPAIPPITSFGCDPMPDGSQGTSATGGSGGQNIGTQRCVLPPSCSSWGNTWGYYNIVTNTNGTKEQQAWNYLATFQEAGFFWAEPGSEVTINGDNEIVYIANILPSTVHQVKAYRTFSVSNLRQLTTVPNTYYTVRQSDFGSYTTTEIVFDRPLSLRGEGWEDDIYVTLTSSVGPNPVDIMEWLITKYTSFTWDSSFASVKTAVDNYPMNFKVPGRMNILRLLQEMAFQGRMALVLRNDQFHLIYLSAEPSEDGNITESDVLANSLVLDHTDTEDLVTKFVANWRPECYLEDPYKVILRYNISKYGTQEREFDFYCYNIQELVIKSATFWLIRMANTWRKIICQTPVNKLALESLDGVFVTLPDIASGEIKCRVETATYNSNDNAIDFVLQTPVRSGETTAYDFHYPAAISVEELHPTNQDLQFGNAGGSGPNVDVEAPVGHVLGQPNQLPSGFTFGQKSPCENLSATAQFVRPLNLSTKCRPDHGDQQPSDIDDVKPSVPLQNDNSVIPPSFSPVNETTDFEVSATADLLSQEGKNADMGQQITNNLNTGTGSEEGAGANNGAGSGDNDQNSAQGVKDALSQLPTGDELDAAGVCYFALRVHFADPVNAVRIDTGETCQSPGDPEPEECSSPNGCTCDEPGKTGCYVGQFVTSITETFYFATLADQNDFECEISRLIESEATVGEKHPVYKSEFQKISGCTFPDTEEGESGIIGYDAASGSEASVIGFKDFFTENYVAPTAVCDHPGVNQCP